MLVDNNLITMDHLQLSKKDSELRTNVKKLEHVLYELSLIKATGRQVHLCFMSIGPVLHV